jgi:hypothetical protein
MGLVVFSLFAVVVIVLATAAGAAEAAKREVLLTGQLLTENCLTEGRLSACSIESATNSRLVLFTGDRKLYVVELERAPQWKIDSAFGKHVVIKGTIKGSKIFVNDVVALGGKKKLSKACL